MRIMRMKHGSLVLAGALLLGACDLDLADPNSPNEEEVTATANGIRQVAIGLQAEWGNELSDPVYIAALVTDEVGAIPQAFESYRRVDAGQSVDNDLGPSTETWGGMYDVVQVANVLLENTPNAPLEPETKSGILALAKFFKALAFGNLLQVYERIPIDVGLNNLHPTFVSRQEGLATVLQLLNEAKQQLQTTPPGDEFRNQILAPGFDFLNTIEAMTARFSLIAGDLPAAFSAAQRVDLLTLSEFRFGTNDPNPVWNMWLNSGNAFRMLPEDRFRLQAQTGDQRVGYWVKAAAITGSTVPLDSIVRYNNRLASFPAYFPDEMRLVQAEVLARQGDTGGALTLVNQVRTPCSSPRNEPVACLPPLTALDVPTEQALLDAILREREYELYVQGLRWSDLRRFGKPVKYQFMMTPRTECQRNENAPPDICLTTTPGTGA